MTEVVSAEKVETDFLKSWEDAGLPADRLYDAVRGFVTVQYREDGLKVTIPFGSILPSMEEDIAEMAEAFRRDHPREIVSE